MVNFIWFVAGIFTAQVVLSLFARAIMELGFWKLNRNIQRRNEEDQ